MSDERADMVELCELIFGRNDVATQKAKDLGASHNVKTAAYKVDG